MTIVPLARLLNNNEILLLEKDAYYSLKDRRVTDKVLTKFTSLVRNDSTLTALRLKGHNTTISLPIQHPMLIIMVMLFLLLMLLLLLLLLLMVPPMLLNSMTTSTLG